ncbi:peptidoglycan DD-metalloendopeptidase family protein [Candidatus Micrarchaeota archaeon]|nr:peptidoglycan DD-metalloendopeptidase family protein [Candidatus Micrarchaeota archaeon]
MRRGQGTETLLLMAAVAVMAVVFIWFVTQPASTQPPTRAVSPTPRAALNASPAPSPTPFPSKQVIETKGGAVEASQSTYYSDGSVYDDFSVSNQGDEPVDVGISSAVSPTLAQESSKVNFVENNTANSTLVSTRPAAVYSDARLPPRSTATRKTVVRNASAQAGGVAHVVTPLLSKEEREQVAPVVQQMASSNVSVGSQPAEVVERILNDESKPLEERVAEAQEYLSDIEQAFREGRQLPQFNFLGQLQDSVSLTVSDSFPYASADVPLLPTAFGQPLVRLEGLGSAVSVEQGVAWGTLFARISVDFSSQLEDGRLPFDSENGSLEVMLAEAMQRKSIQVEVRVLHDSESRVEVTDLAVVLDGDSVEADAASLMDARSVQEGDGEVVEREVVGEEPSGGNASQAESVSVSGALLRFVVLPDMHVSCEDGLVVFGRRAVEAVAERIKPAFVIQTGDFISATAGSTADCIDSMRSSARSQVLRPLSSASIPFYPSAGNHDVVGAAKSGYSDFARSLPGPQVSGPSGRGSYYSFDAGDSHFVSLYAPGTSSISTAQLEWLRQDLASAKQRGAKNFFTFAHSPLVAPPIFTGPSGSTPSPGGKLLASSLELMALLREYGVVHFAGHIHVFADRESDDVRDVIAGMVGGGKRKLQSLSAYQPWTFVVVEVAGSQVRVTRVEWPDYAFDAGVSQSSVGSGPSPQFDFSNAACPVSGSVSTHFAPPQHLGTSFAATSGAGVVAPLDGIVAFAGEAGNCGNAVELFHGLDAEGRGVYSGYCFLSQTSVQQGVHVSKGQEIGKSGTQAYVKLHFFSEGQGIASAADAVDLSKNNFVDPLQYFGSCQAG